MELQTALKSIMEHRERIHVEDRWDDPVVLSDIMTKLAVYNAYLAEAVAPLHKGATDKAYAVFTEARTTLPVTTAEQMSRGESTSERELYENVKNVYSATANLISVLQSRLRVIENQRKQEGLDG